MSASDDGQPPANARLIPVTYRAWATPATADEQAAKETGPRRTRRAAVDPTKAITWTLTFDTETTINTSQALKFGVSRLSYRSDATDTPRTVEEVIFHADDLADADPDGYATLRRYAETASATVDGSRRINTADGWVPVQRRLLLMTRTEWVERVLWRAMLSRVTIVGFNLPFDLSRLAIHIGPAMGATYYGGFSLQLWERSSNRPRIKIRTLDSKKAFISVGGFKEGSKPNGWKGAPRFLDCRTLAFALTGQGFSLDSACDPDRGGWDVEHGKTPVTEHGRITSDYIDYCRRDVLATEELCTELLRNFHAYQIPGLTPDKAYSPASLAKKTLAGLGVTGPLSRNPGFDRAILGASMEAFYGGRSEVRIRRQHLPVQVHDFTSMYPSVNTLMGLWGLLTPDTITADDATEEVRCLLSEITTDDLYDPARWRELVGICQIVPDGDLLPVRGEYRQGDTPTIGLNPLYSDRPTWFTISDLVASKIRTGRTPNIVRAVRFTPHGTASTLTQSQLGSLTIDPTTDDLFKMVIELRKTEGTDKPTQGLLKVVANAGAYGIFSEFNVNKTNADGKQLAVAMDVSTGDEQFQTDLRETEIPGAYCFPPIAATITGAARLMLALLERAVTDAGGSWVFCDTDSMSIVTSDAQTLWPCPGGAHLNDDGQPCVQALTSAQTQAIRARFDTELNPYDKSIIPNLLKDEYSATCYAVSAKRYGIYTLTEDGRVVGRNDKGREILGTEHGLGHLLDPRVARDDPATPQDSRDHTGWTNELWRTVIAYDLGIPGGDGNTRWNERPALSRVSVTSPHVLKGFARYNRGKPFRDQVKPYNFVNRISTVFPTEPGSLIAPYDPDPTNVTSREWTSLATPDAIIGAQLDQGFEEPTVGDIVATVQGMTSVVQSHDLKRESKYLDPVTGQPCSPNTRGLLGYTPTIVRSVRFSGKEVKDLDGIGDDALVADREIVYRQDDPWAATADTLRQMGLSEIRRRLDKGDDQRQQLREHAEADIDAMLTRRSAVKSPSSKAMWTRRIRDRRAELADRIAQVTPQAVSDRELRRLVNRRTHRPNPRLLADLSQMAHRWTEAQEHRRERR